METKKSKKSKKYRSSKSISNKRSKKRKSSIKFKKYKEYYNRCYDDNFIINYNKNLIKMDEINKNDTERYGINKIEAKKFINEQLSVVRQNSAKDLIDNTIYLSYSKLNTIVEKLVIKLYKENILDLDNIYLYVGKPCKSYYIMAILFMKYVYKHGLSPPKYFIKNIENKLIHEINGNPLIIIDDISYSGTQLNGFLYKIYESNKKYSNIFILLTVLNTVSKNVISNFTVRDKYSRRIKVPLPYKLIYLDEFVIEPLICKIGIERWFYLNVFFSIFTPGIPLVSLYLCHKIADEASTFQRTLTYGQIIPSNFDYNHILQMYDNSYYFIPEIDSKILNKLLQVFNSENKTKFDITKNYYVNLRKIFIFLFNKLKTIDIILKQQTIITFRPFINNLNFSLTEIISMSNVKNFDYGLFIAFKNCIQLNNTNCSMDNSFIIEYIKKYTDKQIENLIKIHDLITNYKCITPWYCNWNPCFTLNN